MYKQMIFKVKMKPESNPDDLIGILSEISSKTDFEFFQYEPNETNVELEQRWLIQVGLTKALTTEPILEALGTPGAKKSDILSIIQNYLDRIIKTDRLFIIDQYIFPKNFDSDYSDYLVDLLKKYLPNLKEIVFITNKRHMDCSLKNTIVSKIKLISSSIIVQIKYSKKFHDRFWLSDFNDYGLFLGTSLNGYGKKYALIDYIEPSDVQEIFKGLRKEKII